MIKNLSQLKKELQAGTQFKILGHIRPACIGEVREVTLANTVGLYSKVLTGDDISVNSGNDGKGLFMDWGKATAWAFSNGECTCYFDGTNHVDENRIISLEVIR